MANIINTSSKTIIKVLSNNKPPSLILLPIRNKSTNKYLFLIKNNCLSATALRYLSRCNNNKFPIFQQSSKINTNYANRFQQINDENNIKNSSTQKNPKNIESINFKPVFIYGFYILVGVVGGVVTGYWLMLDQLKISFDNETKRAIKYEPTKLIQHSNSKYSNFPLAIHVYQYESCPYCSQIRAYLDYFGFNYKVTEVDSYSKNEIIKFTKARSLPIVTIQDKKSKKRWHLANATTVLSALESLRNDKKDNYANILNLYLPVLKGNSINSAHSQYKYHVSNSDINSIEWRKWINNVAIPVFKLNTMNSMKDLFEAFDYFAEKSDWHQRYGKIKFYYVYYKNLLKTHNHYKSLIEQLNTNRTPRELLHETIEIWENALDHKKFISGTNIPNLADIAMYGNVRAYEGCALFRESIAKHTKFRRWYEDMRKETIKGYQQHENKNFFYLQALDIVDEGDSLENESFAKRFDETLPKKNTEILDLSRTQATQKENYSSSSSLVAINNKNDLSQMTLFRVLTLNYMINLVAFAFAGYMGK